MANNLIQIKRTSVSGRAANTSTLTNPGELALNMTDGILYSTNGSVVFEVGANNTNSIVTGTLTLNAVSANGSLGTAGQVLTSNGSVTYWSTVSGSGGGASVTVANTVPGSASDGDLWFNSEDGSLYVYYGSDSVWVGVSGPPGEPGVDGADGADGVSGISTGKSIAMAMIFG